VNDQSPKQRVMEKLSNVLLLATLGIVFAVAFLAPQDAQAGPFEQAAAIASAAAGKPVQIVCTWDNEEWDRQVQAVSFGQQRGTNVAGYAYTGEATMWLNPGVCTALFETLNNGIAYSGLRPAAFALLTLLHESAHLSGIRDEGAADCKALGQFKTYIDDIGVGATVRIRTIVGTKYVYRTVPNPAFSRLYQIAVVLHKQRPPTYLGDC
jgi:hypothetical protein